jgi:hypothetical protein
LGSERLPLSAEFSRTASSIISKGEARKWRLIEASFLLMASMTASNFFRPVVMPVSSACLKF